MKKKHILPLLIFLLFALSIFVAAMIYRHNTPDAVHPPTFAPTSASAISETSNGNL